MEIAELNWFERIFARRWMGGDLVDRGSWTAAERRLRRAVELQPERVYHLVDLGALLARRGREDEARHVLERALRVPLEDPSQEAYRTEARRWLEELPDAAPERTLRPPASSRPADPLPPAPPVSRHG
jgi:uncharacterized protein HemY